ncbi:formimidoylglutamase [Croceivirga radicis]|uniref:Formimidoylglutamase n=1 Tax=Croceivirga radicis TaxID=1929488 RepID=A0A1V6LTZ7_9FLAO|nr:formimidoylglutamase [Croceivirga radicis]OQD43651.1 formimidoylglutamase [Croceivirga radicis]
MVLYTSPSPKNWNGRKSEEQLYLHEKVELVPITEIANLKTVQYALLGYACDEGVRRNQGRTGAINGPDAIKKMLGKMPNHLPKDHKFLDVGNVACVETDLEHTQQQLAKNITALLDQQIFPIALGGGHDIAYAHYKGIKGYLKDKKPKAKLGIINFDAHFDLRNPENGPTSGTPFFQIAKEEKEFNYLCIGIRKDANDKQLFETARELDVVYIERQVMRLNYLEELKTWLKAFIEKVDCIYLTIDLDGFSSAFAPGVSAASPMGFEPQLVLELLTSILDSGKLLSMDIAELNPDYDIDNQTAKLAASLVHFVIHEQPV